MTEFLDIGLLILLLVTAIGALWQRDLFAVVMMFGIYSLLAATLFAVLDAVDVAFTEAAVGAGISTILMLGALSLVGRWAKSTPGFKPGPALAAVLVGAVLIWGTWDMPPFGAGDNPIHQHVVDHYLKDSREEIGIPNIVTVVLASYRGYDTLGELTVILTAGVGVWALLGARRRSQDQEDQQ